VLRVNHLTKHFEEFSLEGVSFTLPAGYVMGLIGPNGAGKTTTLRSILGTVRRDGGEILVGGLDPANNGAAVRGLIGFVHEEPKFYRHLTLRRTARQVSRFYRDWDEQVFSRTAGAFGLDLRRRFGVLSRGTRMKFALALALAHHARLIVLDEPTSGLDPVFRRELLDLLRERLEEGRTSVLFSTHITRDLERIADFVTLLQAGRAIFSASRDELQESWALVKGGSEVIDRLGEQAGRLFLGWRRGAHGFEALTRSVDEVRGELGDSVLLERPSLDDVVLLTSGTHDHA